MCKKTNKKNSLIHKKEPQRIMKQIIIKTCDQCPYSSQDCFFDCVNYFCDYYPNKTDAKKRFIKFTESKYGVFVPEWCKLKEFNEKQT